MANVIVGKGSPAQFSTSMHVDGDLHSGAKGATTGANASTPVNTRGDIILRVKNHAKQVRNAGEGEEAAAAVTCWATLNACAS